jgi:hypothetical protein
VSLMVVGASGAGAGLPAREHDFPGVSAPPTPGLSCAHIYQTGRRCD